MDGIRDFCVMNATTYSTLGSPAKILFVGSGNSSNLYFANRLRRLTNVGIVTWMTSGQESINQYSTHLPDIVFVDVLTDDLSGIETSRWMREQDRHLKIVLVSIFPVVSFLHESKHLNLNGYLPKSIGMNDLDQSVVSLQINGDSYGYILSTTVFSSWLAELSTTGKLIHDRSSWATSVMI